MRWLALSERMLAKPETELLGKLIREVERRHDEEASIHLDDLLDLIDRIADSVEGAA